MGWVNRNVSIFIPRSQWKPRLSTDWTHLFCSDSEDSTNIASIYSSSLSLSSSLSNEGPFRFPFPFFTICKVSAFHFFTACSIEEMVAFPFPVFFDLTIDIATIENIARTAHTHKKVSQQPISSAIGLTLSKSFKTSPPPPHRS